MADRISSLLISRTMQRICDKYYEQGRRNRSKRAVWQNYVARYYQISYRTFLRHLERDVSNLDQIIMEKERTDAEKIRKKRELKLLRIKVDE